MADVPLRIACVTGVSRGLGAALAAELLARGSEVVGLGRAADASLVDPRFSHVRADLADVATLDGVASRAFAAVAARSPAEVVLVNNAAVAEPLGKLGALEADDIARALAVNLVAPAILANAFVRALRGRAKLRIVNVSSGLAVRALAGASLYCTAKAGLEMLTAVAAAEAATGEAAVSARPGIIDTPMQVTMRTQRAEALPDVAIFRDFHAGGRLQSAAETARWLVERAVLGDAANGTTLSYPS